MSEWIVGYFKQWQEDVGQELLEVLHQLVGFENITAMENIHLLVATPHNMQALHCDKNMLTRRRESDTYLATVSRQIKMKIDK